MKNSNKLLLGGLLAVILLVTGIHIALSANYRNGHYTVYTSADKRAGLNMQSYPGITSVTIRNIRGGELMFGEVLEVENVSKKRVQVAKVGDSLIITGANAQGEFTSGTNIKLTLPKNVSLSVINSMISFESSGNDLSINPSISVENTYAVFSSRIPSFQLGHVKLSGVRDSRIVFEGFTSVDSLDIILKNSILDHDEGEIRQLTIAADTNSHISLHSKHLIKANITTIPNNP